jgi:heme/copper-type cytochrome/quinol oxidase subunit 2
MTRLRSFAATARQARLRGVAATARQAFATGAAVMIFGSARLLACPQCFGAEETSMIDGAKLGVLVMLGITLTVQGAFVGFFFYLRQRAKRIADVELDTEWSELQRSPRTS